MNECAIWQTVARNVPCKPPISARTLTEQIITLLSQNYKKGKVRFSIIYHLWKKLENRKLKTMTTPQFFLVLYLCCFLCSWAGAICYTRDAHKKVLKQGYKIPYWYLSPFTWDEALLCAAPVLNFFYPILIYCWYDRITDIVADTTINFIKKGNGMK